MGTIYIDTGGNAANSGSSDNNAADLTGTSATFVSGTTVSLLTDNPDLSALVTSGATQSSINIAGATNANRTIFWITAFDNTAGVKTVTLDVAPTGMTTNAWKIGGRYLSPSGAGAVVWEAACRAGDEFVYNNDPASRTAAFVTLRNDATGSSAFCKIRSKTGSRILLKITNTASNIAMGSFANYSIEDLDFEQQGASGNVISLTGSGTAQNVKNCRVKDGGGHGYSAAGATSNLIAGNDISGVLGDAVNVTGGATTFFGNNLHDCGGDGLESTATAPTSNIWFNLIHSNYGNGIFFSGPATSFTHSARVMCNTVAYNGDCGLRIVDADSKIDFFNNIFLNNGIRAGTANALGTTSEAALNHGYNCFFSTGTNLSIIAANSTESTADPLITTADAVKTFVDGDVNTGTENITITGHGFTAGQTVTLSTTGVLPTGLSAATPYYVLVTDANTIQLSATVGGAAINITAAAGGGTHTARNGSIGVFTLGSSSPAKASGFPGTFLSSGAANVGYLDMGAIQRQESAAGGATSYGYS